ncbi:MAG: L-histidine N(alpha)-methyltransferase [Acidobacteriota bacterium]
MLNIKVCLSENQLAEEFYAALTTRNLPEKFFYWFPLSVRAWLNLCGEGPYKNFSRSQRLLVDSAADISARLTGDGYEVLSLGPGNGEKDLFLLDRVGPARIERYLAVDASQALLEIAAAKLQEAGYNVVGIKADLANCEHIRALAANAQTPPRLVLLLGNTLGAFDPLEFVPRLLELLRPEDRLLVDGEIFRGQETMAGYDNPINRQFAFAPWRSVGVKEADGELRFVAREDTRRTGLYVIAKDFSPLHDLKLIIAGEPLHLCTGERVAMNFSYKYYPETFRELWSAAHTEAFYLTDDNSFCMALVAPRQ